MQTQNHSELFVFFICMDCNSAMSLSQQQFHTCCLRNTFKWLEYFNTTIYSLRMYKMVDIFTLTTHNTVWQPRIRIQLKNTWRKKLNKHHFYFVYGKRFWNANSNTCSARENVTKKKEHSYSNNGNKTSRTKEISTDYYSIEQKNACKLSNMPTNICTSNMDLKWQRKLYSKKHCQLHNILKCEMKNKCLWYFA